MELKEEVRKLIEIQELDLKIYSLTYKRDIEKPQELQELKKKIEEKKIILSNFEDKVKNLQLKRKDKELDLYSKEENVKKSHSQLYQLKTNKEYQAKLLEIESLKADVSILEDDIIKILDELDNVEDQLRKAKDNVNQEERIFKENERRINEEIKILGAKIKDFQDKKSMLSQNVEKNILSVYDRLIKSRGGVAIVPIEEENCGACHMKVTAQKINEIKMYKDLVFCEVCVRILYIKEDFH